MTAIVARALALLAFACGLGFVVNAARSDGVSFAASASAAACTATAANMSGGEPVRVLPVTDAVRMCGDQGTLVADARPAPRFAEGHVAGAIHLPCAASGAVASQALGRLDGKHTLIVYGDSTDEARPVAEDIRQRAGRPGLRVVVLAGGFAAWNRAGLACSSGPCPECKDVHE